MFYLMGSERRPVINTARGSLVAMGYFSRHHRPALEVLDEGEVPQQVGARTLKGRDMNKTSLLLTFRVVSDFEGQFAVEILRLG